MDFGKLALSKLDDLERMLHFARKENKGIKMLLFDLSGNAAFTGSFNSHSGGFILYSCLLSLDVSFTLNSPSECLCSCALILNGVQLESKKIEIAGGKNQYFLSFSCGQIVSGEYEFFVKLKIEDTTSRQLSNLNVRLLGEIESVTKDCKITVFKEGNFLKAAYNDRDFIYYSIILNNSFTIMNKYNNRGDFSFCECSHYGTNNRYDTVCLFVDEGKLFLQVLPYHSNFLPYRILIDENVTSISSVNTKNPRGCILVYLKGGKVICRHIEKDLIQDRLTVQNGFEAAATLLAVGISAVQGILDGFGFILTEKAEKNSMYLNCGNFHFSPYDTVNAEITAIIEDLL